MSGSPLSHRPLPAGSGWYVRRPEPERLLGRALALGLNVAVVGDAGTGKTTLVLQVLADAGVADPRVLRIDCHGLNAAETHRRLLEGFGWVDQGFHWEPKPGYEMAFGGLVSATHKRVPNPPDPTRIDTGDIDWLVREITDFTTPDEIAGGGIELPVIAVVEGPSVAAVNAIFGQHRDRLWDLPVQWILVSRHPVASDAALFFEAQVPLDDLDAPAARDLLERRLDAAGQSNAALVDAVVSQVPLRPRELIAAARDGLLRQDLGGDRLRVQGVLTERAAALGRGQAMLMAELIALGGTHASDEEFLRRLGYSRSRVVALLNELQADGLVEARRDGRRVIYTPAERLP